MKKKKIADSIIIRVGGGIREVRREQDESDMIEAAIDAASAEPDIEEHEDIQSYQPGPRTSPKISKDKIIN